MPQSIQVAHSAITLTVIDGIPTTTSNQVAQHFGKRHDNVMQAIESLREQVGPDHALNFQEMVTEVQIGSGATRKDPAYRLTRDGFTLLAMGFTGKKALAFKLAYIDAFNAMERQMHQAPSYAVAPQQTLSEQEASMLRGLITGHAEALPKERRAEFIIKAWSKLKAHFKTDYRHIPAHCFTEALSIVSRYIAENAAAPQMPAHTDSRQLDEAARSLIQAALHLQQASNAIKRADGGVGSALWLNPPLESK